MIWITAIRIVLGASFFGIVVIILYPCMNTAARISGIGIALQIAGVALAIPELAHRLSNKPATDLVVWADTFMPVWRIINKILRKIFRKQLILGQLIFILSVLGIMLVFVGLIMQYLANYF